MKLSTFEFCKGAALWLAFCWVVGSCVGCTAQLQRPASNVTTYDCASLDHDHRTWGALAKASGVLSGTGGLATLPIPDDQKTARISLAVSAAVVGAFAAAAVYVEQDAAATWARNCSQ